jgi:hypothetical protein
VKVCDRCGRILTDEDAKNLEKLKDYVEYGILMAVLGKCDLCRFCIDDFIKKFESKIYSLRKEVWEWVKSGRWYLP